MKRRKKGCRQFRISNISSSIRQWLLSSWTPLLDHDIKHRTSIAWLHSHHRFEHWLPRAVSAPNAIFLIVTPPSLELVHLNAVNFFGWYQRDSFMTLEPTAPSNPIAPLGDAPLELLHGLRACKQLKCQNQPWNNHLAINQSPTQSINQPITLPTDWLI